MVGEPPGSAPTFGSWKGVGSGTFSDSDLTTQEDRTQSNDPFDSTNRIRSPCPFSGTNGFSYDGVASHPDNA